MNHSELAKRREKKEQHFSRRNSMYKALRVGGTAPGTYREWENSKAAEAWGSGLR